MKLPVLASLISLLWVASPSPVEADTLTSKQIKKVLKYHGHEVKRCYLKHAYRQPAATGKVRVTVIVEPSGKIRPKPIKIKAPGVRGKRFYQCVSQKVKKWRFPLIDNPIDLEIPFYYQHTRRRHG